MASQAPTRVLIVEDHQMVAGALRSMLQAEPFLDVVGIAASADDAVKMSAQHRPDVVVTDFQLGAEQAPVWLDRFREAAGGCAILVVTGWATERAMLSALDAGANGFLSKEQPMSDLADGVKRVAAGEMVVAPSLLGVLARRSAGSRRDRTQLSRRELEVLDQLASGADTAAMAIDLGLSQHTVRNHVAKVMLRLGVHSRLEAVSEAVRLGIISPPVPRQAVSARDY